MCIFCGDGKECVSWLINLVNLTPPNIDASHYGDAIERNGVSNHQFHDCLLNRSFRRRSKEASKLCDTSLCAGNSPVTGEFPAQKASNAEMFLFDDVIMYDEFLTVSPELVIRLRRERICVPPNWMDIGLDYVLWFIRHQSIIWTNADLSSKNHGMTIAFMSALDGLVKKRCFCWRWRPHGSPSTDRY